MTDDKPKYATGGPIFGPRPYLYDPAVDGPIEWPSRCMHEIRQKLAADLGYGEPCGCVTTETTPEGQHTPRTFNIDMSACDKHRTGGN